MYFTHQVVKKTAYSLYSVHPPLDLGLALQSLATPRVVCGQQHLHPLGVFLLCFFFLINAGSPDPRAHKCEKPYCRDYSCAAHPWSSPQVRRTTRNPGPFWASFWHSPAWAVLPARTKPAGRTCSALFPRLAYLQPQGVVKGRLWEQRRAYGGLGGSLA